MGKREIRWLHKEMPAWVNGGILSEDGAARLRTLYDEADTGAARNMALVICGILGAVLIGSGIILLFAHNWEEIPRHGRAAISLGLLVVAQGLAAWTLLYRRQSRAWREGTSTFLLLAVGATVSLIGQTYQLPGTPRGFLIVWMLLSVPLVYLMDASLPALFFIAGITAWGGFLFPEGYWYWPVALLIVPHLWMSARDEPSGIRTRLLFWFASLLLPIAASVTLSEALHAFWFPVVTSVLALLYLAGRFWPVGGEALWRDPLRKVGAVGVPAVCFVLSFKPPWEEVAGFLKAGFRPSGNIWADLIPVCAFCLGIILFLRKAIRAKQLSGVLYGLAPFVTIPAYLLARAGYGTWPAVLMLNFYLFALALETTISGLREQSLQKLNAGLVVLAALIMARFFDSQFGFVVRGTAFILLGIGFLAANVRLLRDAGRRTQ